jgi:NAD(P)-dependent dehydrogenase (short-subunit alcohol dehydrogenase family)
MDHSRHYRGKRVVVTGCFSGIGHAVAQRLIECGAEVHGLDVRACHLSLASFTPLDLRDPCAIEATATAIGGPIDAVFNCAGLPPGPSAVDVMTVNFIGTRYLTELLVPFMAAGSAIVSVSSNGGAGWMGKLPALKDFIAAQSFAEAVAYYERRADVGPAAYSFSKEALIVWTMQQSANLIKCGIRMNCTTPGAVQTPMLVEIEKSTPAALIDVVAQPIGRRSSAKEQAAPLLFLNSDAASYINGAVLPVDGGFISSRIVGA